MTIINDLFLLSMFLFVFYTMIGAQFIEDANKRVFGAALLGTFYIVCSWTDTFVNAAHYSVMAVVMDLITTGFLALLWIHCVKVYRLKLAIARMKKECEDLKAEQERIRSGEVILDTDTER